MRALCLSFLLLSTPALAADVGDTVFAKATTPSTRFADADTAGPSFEKSARLVVLVAEGDRLRVMGPDTTFGWIAADAVTRQSPVSEADLQEMLKNIDLKGMGMQGGGGLGVGGALTPPGP